MPRAQLKTQEFDFDGKIRRYSTALGTVQQDPGESSMIHNFCLHNAATEKKNHTLILNTGIT